ncbi:MAG: hypothetical protein ACM3IJ_06205 [Candidatus Levyibacteriota bacterium]
MKKFFKLIEHDKAVKYSLVISGIFLLIMLILLGIEFSHLPPILPLFNSLPWGRARLMSNQFIFIIPAFLFSMAILNMVFFQVLYKKYTLLARMLSVNIFLAFLLGMFAFIQILLLVF